MWSWTSTYPGRIVLPATSISRAPAGIATDPRGPTAAMRLSVTMTSAFSITSSPFIVITRAPRSTTVPRGVSRGTRTVTWCGSEVVPVATSYDQYELPIAHCAVRPSAPHSMKSAPTVVSRFAGSAEVVDGRKMVGRRSPVGGTFTSHTWLFTSASTCVPVGSIRISSASPGGFRVHSQPFTRRCARRSLPSHRTDTSPSTGSVNHTRVESLVKCGSP